MKEQLITFETAKSAKEKGFNTPTFYYYRAEGAIVKNVITYRSNTQMNVWDDTQEKWSAPTQSLLQKWLREEKGCVILVYLYDRDREDIFSYEIIRRINNRKCETPYLSYEKALEKGLQEVLKLIKL